MSFVRPEARAAMWRWREPLLAVAAMVIGLWWILGAHGLLNWIGYAVLAAGAALFLAGVQRARFRGGRDGPGVVQIDEGQIAYFGPLTGGAVARSELTGLTLDPGAKPAHWVLSQPGQSDLYIPLNADGAEALFDVFSSLPGIRTEFMLRQMQRTRGDRVVIWQRSAEPPRSRVLN